MQVNSPASKDTDAKWTIKSGHWHLGYKLHARTDAEGFIEQIHVTPANVVDVNHLVSVLDKIEEGVTVYADKGYDSKDNRAFLENSKLKDGIMRKAHRNKPLNRDDIERNKGLAKVRYRVEQSFAILHRLFKCKRASYFGLDKVKGQMNLKVMCLNLLKAANKLRLIVPIAA
ncbi:transposase [Wielerella bovis]|uniref:transposase n=1 Tax=Wielerella bovis TaxID=2917790 RepID=UPI003D297D0B